jgi:hypothetical protein
MRRMVLFLSLIAPLLFTSTSAATPPARFTFTFDETFPSFISAVCGFDVFVHLEGTATATLFFGRSGTLIREIDTNPNLKVTIFAPTTGKSFTYPSAGVFVQDYIEGGVVGSPVIATLTGCCAGTGSTPPNAGRLVFNAVVIDTTPEGIPVVEFTSEISASGHINDDLAEARCATLSDP